MRAFTQKCCTALIADVTFNKTVETKPVCYLLLLWFVRFISLWNACLERRSCFWFLIRERRQGREIFEVLGGKEKNNLITSWRKCTDICLDDLHLWNVCLYHSHLFSDFSDLLISSESARSVFSRLRSHGRRHAEISRRQSLCYALISLCAVRQLRLSCKTERNFLLLQILSLKSKPFYLVHWFKKLRNKLVSVVVNLCRAHFDFIRYDGYFLYLITGKPVGTKWVEPARHSCLIAFYLNSSEIDILKGIY